MARTKSVSVPEVGDKAPEFSLPSAQGGQLRLSMRTARGPAVVVFYRNSGSEECVEYFKALAVREGEINHAGASIAGIGVAEPDESREFARLTGLKSYLLYDYARVATGEYGLLEKDKERGDSARPAAFIVGSDNEVVHAWVGERPSPDEILAKITEITGLPKAEEDRTGRETEESFCQKSLCESKLATERRSWRGREAREAFAGGAGEAPGRAAGSPGERSRRRVRRWVRRRVRRGVAVTAHDRPDDDGRESSPEGSDAGGYRSLTDPEDLRARLSARDGYLEELTAEVGRLRLAADEARASREAGEERVRALEEECSALGEQVRGYEREAQTSRRRREGRDREVERLRRALQRRDEEKVPAEGSTTGGRGRGPGPRPGAPGGPPAAGYAG